MPIAFTATIALIGKRLIVPLPEPTSANLPSRGQVAAAVTLDECSFDTVLEPDGRGGHWISLAGVSQAASWSAGQSVCGQLEVLASWPEPAIPADLHTALAHASDLTDTWAEITARSRWEWVRWINETKNTSTRARRVEVTISKLRAGKRRPCCFNLAACTDPEVAVSGKLALGG